MVSALLLAASFRSDHWVAFRSNSSWRAAWEGSGTILQTCIKHNFPVKLFWLRVMLAAFRCVIGHFIHLTNNCSNFMLRPLPANLLPNTTISNKTKHHFLFNFRHAPSHLLDSFTRTLSPLLSSFQLLTTTAVHCCLTNDTGRHKLGESSNTCYKSATKPAVADSLQGGLARHAHQPSGSATCSVYCWLNP